MENIIKKIEQYQAENKVTYDAAMDKPFNEIVFGLAGLIGNLQAQLAMVKNELQNGKYIQLEKSLRNTAMSLNIASKTWNTVLKMLELAKMAKLNTLLLLIILTDLKNKMDNFANITISESDYKSLLLNGAFLDIKIISIKILPNDSEIKDDVTYKALQNEYKKARNKLEDYRFQF